MISYPSKNGNRYTIKERETPRRMWRMRNHYSPLMEVTIDTVTMEIYVKTPQKWE